MKTFGNILTAMITPMASTGQVDFDGAVTLANYLLDNGSDGLVVCGTTGESPSISVEDKLELFRRIVKACGHKGSIIANTGSNNTEHSVDFTREASKTGVDGIMAVVPYYNKPNQKGLYMHFSEIAKATDLPVMIYNVPGRTGGSITPATIAKLAQDIPNIKAVKEASGNVAISAEIYSLVPEEFMIYSGDDGLTLPILSVGGVGVISVAAHVVGKEMQAMVQAFKAGRVDEAKAINKEILPLVKSMFITTNPIPVKYAVRQLGLPAGPFRLPMCDPSEEEAAMIDTALAPYK